MPQDINTLREEMLALMKTVDWNYQYSDDHGYWSKEADKAQRVYALARLIPDGDAILSQYFQKKPN